MKLKVALTIAVLMLNASCARVSNSSGSELKPRNSPVEVNEMAPDFTLEDQYNHKVTLSAARGAPTVLVFYRGYW